MKFIQLTLAANGSAIHVRADIVYSVCEGEGKRGAPISTVWLTGVPDPLEVLESPEIVLRRLTGISNS
jgi:hypothetical protein